MRQRPAIMEVPIKRKTQAQLLSSRPTELFSLMALKRKPAPITCRRKADDVNLEKLEEQRRELEVTVVLAQCRLGALTKAIPKAPPNRGNQYTSGNFRGSEKGKGEQLAELGITYQRANEYEKMAAHPEAVQRVIDTEEHVTKAAVLREIQSEAKPHVSNNSGDNEPARKPAAPRIPETVKNLLYMQGNFD